MKHILKADFFQDSKFPFTQTFENKNIMILYIYDDEKDEVSKLSRVIQK
jgi:hypothetical protein